MLNKAIYRSIGKLSIFVSALLFMVGNTNAQSVQPRPVLQQRTIDLSQMRVAIPNQEITPGLIDFENVQGPQIGVGIELSNQYEESHGVRFERGASVHFCARRTDDVMASLCPYPQAASGQRAAVHDVRSGGPVMVVTFIRPVEALTMRINPTGGTLDEVFVAELNGFDENNQQLVNETVRFNWFQNAFSWPTSAGFETDGAQITRVTVTLRRVAQNNQPVRFLIDDLSLVYSPEVQTSPVAVALAEETSPPRVESEIVQSVEVGPAQDELRLYPAATRKRTVIDWDAVDLDLAEQDAQGLVSASRQGEQFIDAAELPLLLPSDVDADSLIVVGNRDSYSAHFTVAGRAHNLYGSRLLTVMSPAAGAAADATNLTLIRSDEAIVGSFSLYGASYSLTRYCVNEDVSTDAACHDGDAMGAVAANLVVVVGDAGRGRP